MTLELKVRMMDLLHTKRTVIEALIERGQGSYIKSTCALDELYNYTCSLIIKSGHQTEYY